MLGNTEQWTGSWTESVRLIHQTNRGLDRGVDLGVNHGADCGPKHEMDHGVVRGLNRRIYSWITPLKWTIDLIEAWTWTRPWSPAWNEP